MRNYLNIGPVHIRVSRKHLASWGFPQIQIGGISLLTRNSDGGLCIASYQKPHETWRWAVGFCKRNGNAAVCRAPTRQGQWHDYYNFGRWAFYVSRQNYHLTMKFKEAA